MAVAETLVLISLDSMSAYFWSCNSSLFLGRLKFAEALTGKWFDRIVIPACCFRLQHIYISSRWNSSEQSTSECRSFTKPLSVKWWHFIEMQTRKERKDYLKKSSSVNEPIPPRTEMPGRTFFTFLQDDSWDVRLSKTLTRIENVALTLWQ